MIQPAAYIKSLALGLWRDGVRVLECTPVLALEYVPGLAARTAAGRSAPAGSSWLPTVMCAPSATTDAS